MIIALIEPVGQWLLSRLGVFGFSYARGRVIRATDDAPAEGSGEFPGAIEGIGFALRGVRESVRDDAILRGKFGAEHAVERDAKRPSLRARRGARGGAVVKAKLGAALPPMWARDP